MKKKIRYKVNLEGGKQNTIAKFSNSVSNISYYPTDPNSVIFFFSKRQWIFINFIITLLLKHGLPYDGHQQWVKNKHLQASELSSHQLQGM